jgi:hypothetical protein
MVRPNSFDFSFATSSKSDDCILIVVLLPFGECLLRLTSYFWQGKVRHKPISN